MSLILEALKKLDREKQAPDRGLLVVGPSAWPSLSEGRPGIGAGALAIGVLAVAGVGGAVWFTQGGRRPASNPPAPAVVAGPATTARATAAAATGNGAAGRSLSSPTSASGRRSAASLPAPSGTAGSKAVAGSEAVETPREAAAAQGRPGPGAAYQLQAISAQDGHPVAILNDRLVREGDSFDGVKVLRIGGDEVEIEVGGRRRVVKF